MAAAGSTRDATSGSHIPPPGAAGDVGGVGDVAALDRLVERALTAYWSTRHAFLASLWKRGAAAATTLLGGDTLATIWCTLRQAGSLLNQANMESAPEMAALAAEEAWALASSVLPLLSTRMDNNTFLPGRCTKEEVEFYKRYELAKRFVSKTPPLSARHLQLTGFGVGYAVALDAALQVLIRYQNGPRPPPQALAFVLCVVDMMLPAARSVREMTLAEEKALAESCRIILRGPADPFIDALRKRWMAPALVAMRAERDLGDVSGEINDASERWEAARRADIAAHGLKHCALPSCDKQEVTVQQYKFCSACRSVWYCSAEHGAKHWREHKTTCRATTAANEMAALSL